MKFLDLYRNNKKAVRDTLTAMWCSDLRNDNEGSYSRQLQNLIENELFASEHFVPLVQCMDRYETVKSVKPEVAESLVGGLWKKTLPQGKYYPPYEHQYLAWKALTNKEPEKLSMVVTTGTGSGKTECFMLPLVHDLLERNKKGQIQAIFLYPLNALMEDQKERLQALLKDTDLTFAVYNGNMPESKGNPNSKNAGQRTLYKRVKEEHDKYPNIVATRDEMRQSPPNIILTNPTMLEYMLLRQKDQALFTKGTLRWIVIDETHTFSGAGAAELAMLIRRVLQAFNLEPKDIRFATSSATIGNAKTKEEEKVNEGKLVQFISDITGVPFKQVKFVKGKRTYIDNDDVSPEVRRCRTLLDKNDYITLSDLFPQQDETIEQKLERLDQLCGLEKNALKAKVHFFYRVPNNGLKIQLDDHKNGVFRIKAQDSSEPNKAPYLELLRCEHCGGYIAIGENVIGTSNEYRPLTKGSDDMFSFNEDSENIRRMIFGLTKNDISDDDRYGDVPVRVDGNCCYTDHQATDENGWRLVHNVQSCCPHCHAQILGKRRDKDNDPENDPDADLSKNVSSFRIPSTFISRVLAPSILPQLHTKERDANQTKNPHNGQQYISFVDSRQAAARSTLSQNIEEERLWLYSRIFNMLNKKKIQTSSSDNKLEELLDKRLKYENIGDTDVVALYDEKIKQLKKELSASAMTWMELYSCLYDEAESDWLSYQFANKSENSDELDADSDKVGDDTKAKYIQSIMIEMLGRRPRMASAPETMGLFTTTYPKLDKVTELPKAVIDFNLLVKGDNKIDLQEWKNLLKIFLDFVVRSNQSIYLKTGNDSHLDIFACQRFGTTKAARRPVKIPHITDDNTTKGGSYPAVALLLAALIAPDKKESLTEVVEENRKSINSVLDELWTTLKDKTNLLQLSERFLNDKWQLDEYKDDDGNQIPSYRLNVIDISFKTIEKAWLCDARKALDEAPVLRPVDTLFMGMSPHTIGNRVSMPISDVETWKPYPYTDGYINGYHVSQVDIKDWAMENRKLMWQNGLWGEIGAFSNRLNSIYSFPKIFVQAEHTAQIDKLVSKHSQELFKNQKINILACSTTMEMGVDLGNLELVLMTSIPPHPSNYKQRAGRSGRNDDTRSACITLCNSDSVGLRTLEDPMQQLIKRPMAVPFVDLQSPQVIQRHVNAFLFRSSGIFFMGVEDGKNNLGQEVIDFFTPFFFDHDEKFNLYSIRKIQEETEVYPSDGMGDESATRYYLFLNYLNGNDQKEKGIPLLANIIPSLSKLLMATCYENETDGCILRCKLNIQQVYDSLAERIEDIREAYNMERDRVMAKPSSGTVVGDRVDSGYGYMLRHKYSECLAQNMISFLATNRFTPNANMPVEVIEFNVNLRNENKKRFDFKASSNPSYALQEAIFQYAPGNTIVLENRTNIIRGLRFTGQYKQTQSFKRLFSDGNDTVIDFPSRLKGSNRKWPVSNKEEQLLVEPVSYIPDINEDYTRIVNKNSYTQVSAQLIGAGPWQGESKNLIAMRSNRDSCDAKILYYNEGIGYGYCFCPSCGKTVLEITNHGSQYKYPEGMNNQPAKSNGQEVSFHYRIDRKDFKNSDRGKRIRCIQKKIMRNVILGGLIQTDYCEIKVRENANELWLSRDNDNDKLLITLGIAITKTFTEYIGKDRKDISFAIMPNGHLCIFDTNPGGSGYSNQLSGQRTMMDVLDLSKKMLSNVTSKEMLLDKYTLRFIDKLDIERTQTLIGAILDSFDDVPDEIATLFPKTKVGVAVIEDIYKSFKDNYNSNREMTLFVNDDWNQWIYQPTPSSDEDYYGGLKQRLQAIRQLNHNNIRLCVFGDDVIPYPIYPMLHQLSEWTHISMVSSPQNSSIYPIAITGDRFYFTNNKKASNANYEWGQSDLYSVPVDFVPKFDDKKVDISYKPQFCDKIILSLDSHKAIKTTELGEIIESRIPRITEEFHSYCKKNKGEMKVIYQDEHLKSPLSFVLALQFIEHFMRKFNMPFSLEFLNEEYDETVKSHTIASNYSNDIDRNEKLLDMANEWKDIVNGNGLICKSVKISTKARHYLPHWRSLQFRLQDRELNLYPNGGIINEWFLDRRDRNNYILTADSLSVEDEISLFRNKEIMYDAEIRDI